MWVPSALLSLVVLGTTSSVSSATPLLQRCEPAIVPADVARDQTVFIVGERFAQPPAGSTLTCHVRGGMNYGLNYAANNTAATWINSTHIACVVPSGVSTFDGRLDVKLNGNESWSNPQAHNASSLPPLSFRTFCEVGFGRRPYLSNETADAELILWPDTAAIADFPATRDAAMLHVCYDIPGTMRNCHALVLPPQGVMAAALPIVVPASPDQRDLNVSINVTLTAGNGAPLLVLDTKYRKLMVAPAVGLRSRGSFVAVDHRRRALRVNGDLFVSQGFYVHSFAQYLWHNITLQHALDDLTGLSQQGVLLR